MTDEPTDKQPEDEQPTGAAEPEAESASEEADAAANEPEATADDTAPTAAADEADDADAAEADDADVAEADDADVAEADDADVAEADDADDAEADDAEETAPKGGTTAATSARADSAPTAPTNADGLVEVRASARFVRRAPRKARLVIDHIRGKSVADARALLAHTPRAAAVDISKLLESAVANAENNFELDPDDLRIHRATVDEGPTIKRFRPRALGRATPIHKRTSHMTITLTTTATDGAAAGDRKARK